MLKKLPNITLTSVFVIALFNFLLLPGSVTADEAMTAFNYPMNDGNANITGNNGIYKIKNFVNSDDWKEWTITTSTDTWYKTGLKYAPPEYRWLEMSPGSPIPWKMAKCLMQLSIPVNWQNKSQLAVWGTPSREEKSVAATGIMINLYWVSKATQLELCVGKLYTHAIKASKAKLSPSGFLSYSVNGQNYKQRRGNSICQAELESHTTFKRRQISTDIAKNLIGTEGEVAINAIIYGNTVTMLNIMDGEVNSNGSKCTIACPDGWLCNDTP